MGTFPLIVFWEAVFEICGNSQVTVFLRRNAFNKIQVKYWRSFAEASEGTLLRVMIHSKSCEAHEREAG